MYAHTHTCMHKITTQDFNSLLLTISCVHFFFPSPAAISFTSNYQKDASASQKKIYPGTSNLLSLSFVQQALEFQFPLLPDLENISSSKPIMLAHPTIISPFPCFKPPANKSFQMLSNAYLSFFLIVTL